MGWRRAPLALEGFSHSGLSDEVNEDDGMVVESLDVWYECWRLIERRYACGSEEVERVDPFVNRQMIKGWSRCSEETVARCSECLQSGLNYPKYVSGRGR